MDPVLFVDMPLFIIFLFVDTFVLLKILSVCSWSDRGLLLGNLWWMRIPAVPWLTGAPQWWERGRGGGEREKTRGDGVEREKGEKGGEKFAK